MSENADLAFFPKLLHGVLDFLGATKNKLLSLTGTADYALWKNVISRAELRWDTCLTGDKPFGGMTPRRTRTQSHSQRT